MQPNTVTCRTCQASMLLKLAGVAECDAFCEKEMDNGSARKAELYQIIAGLAKDLAQALKYGQLSPARK